MKTKPRTKPTTAARADLVWVWDGDAVAAARDATPSRLHEGRTMTQAEAAEILGVGAEAVRRYEVPLEARRQGLTGSCPSVAVLAALATLYGKAPGDFFRQVPADLAA